MESKMPLQKEAVSPKPPCNTVKGAKGPFPFAIGDRQILRDNFTISTWLLLGAILQSLLLLLPIRPSYAITPAVVLLSYRLLNNLCMCFGLKHNTYMDGVVEGRNSAIYPKSSTSEKSTASEEICVMLLLARSNHPLGLFAPGFKDLDDHFKTLILDLDAKAHANGFLGASTWSNISDRETSGELMNVLYFRSYEQLHAFAHADEHRAVWNWWSRNVGKYKHISISHEVYSVPAGKWQTMYTNSHPSNFGSTHHLVKDEDGVERWVSPLVDAREGRFRTSNGRMGRSAGDENGKYGYDPYAAV